MKSYGWFAALCLCTVSMQASAQYVVIPYYDNNPFLFCTLGVPQDCWAPVDAATGAFVVTNSYCYNAVSSALYATVCPMAFPKGLGAGGPSTQVSPQTPVTPTPAATR
ncbi:hypothetical protein [Xanthomonas sp. GPE 39]|uniref:hypothetical protein n=1 Tax=Xanthomonas sp. GPE 39 TaxID=1583099 RepID=UPI000A6138A5|nr:hypothetical protein [Xanthomonas sp. GPE 39]